MSSFEILSVVPLVKLSDQISPRQIAKERVKDYRRKKLMVEQEPPPIGSIRRVFWAASKNEKRTLRERITRLFR